MLPRPRRSDLSNRAKESSQTDKITVSILTSTQEAFEYEATFSFLGNWKWAKQGLGRWTCLQRSYLKISSASSAEESFRTSFSTSWSAPAVVPADLRWHQLAQLLEHTAGALTAIQPSSAWFKGVGLGYCRWDTNFGEKKPHLVFKWVQSFLNIS